IAFAPGASCQTRRIDGRQAGELASQLARASSVPVLLLGAPHEAELFSASSASGVLSLVGKTSVPEFVAIISFAQVVVTAHSAALHIADAFERPVVCLFSGTDLASQWQPRHSPSVLLNQPTACSPCYLLRCPYQLECLDIDPDTVVRAVKPFLVGSRAHLPEFTVAGGH